MPDLLDQLLGIGSTPDWISPLWAMFQDFNNGPYYRFYIDRNAGWSVNGITKVLKTSGVKVWGDTITDGMIIFTVRQAQARWAQYLLQQAGIPILNTPIEGSKPSQSTPRKTAPVTGWKAFLHWLDNQ